MDTCYLKRGIAYTFNIYNKSFSEHLPYVTTHATGGVLSGEISDGVVTTWRSQSGKVFYGNIIDGNVEYGYDDADAKQETLRVYTKLATLKDQVELQKVKIVFTPSHITDDDTHYYLQDARIANVGIELLVYEDYGDFINPEELYHSLLMRRSNRIYDYSYEDVIFDKFLKNFIPAGLRARLTNLPPTFVGWSNNKEFYNPEDLAILSALITDPENDILTYQWSHIGMRTISGQYTTTSVTGTGEHDTTILPQNGLDLAVDVLNDTHVICSGVLTTPPVETMYTFQLICQDSDNTVSGIDQIPVYSIPDEFRFVTWSGDDFYIGDNDLPFSYYPDSTWVPELTKPILYLMTRITTTIMSPRGTWDNTELFAPVWIPPGIVFTPVSYSTYSINEEYTGIFHSPDIYSGLSAAAIIGSGGSAYSAETYAITCSYSTTVS